MFNYLIKIEYDGLNFAGWQSQKNGKTIQDSIELALKKVLKTKIRINGAGRTDKGVHAYSQYANFKVRKKINDKKTFLNSINYFLQKKLISIIDVKEKKEDFHARYNAKVRTYEYLIINRQGNLSIYKNRAWHVKKKIDLKLMKKGAKLLEGTHNFSTFRSSTCQATSPIRTIKKILLKKDKSKIILTFHSKSFLQQQVRSMVGSLKYLGEGKWSLDDFKNAFKSKKRKMCAPPAPAHGLYLSKVVY